MKRIITALALAVCISWVSCNQVVNAADSSVAFQLTAMEETDTQVIYDIEIVTTKTYSSVQVSLGVDGDCSLDEVALKDGVAGTLVDKVEKDGIYYFGLMNGQNVHEGSLEAFTITVSKGSEVSTIDMDGSYLVQITDSGGADKIADNETEDTTVAAIGSDTEEDTDIEDTETEEDTDTEDTETDEDDTVSTSSGSSSANDNDDDSDDDSKLVVVTDDATPQASLVFSDVADHWALMNINELYVRGIIGGYGDGTFRPDDTVTRAEFVKMIVEALEVAEAEAETMEDMVDHWAKAYVATAVANDIVDGYGDGTFGPDDKITREQMAVVLANAMALKADAEAVYGDREDIADWAVDAVDAVTESGYMNGYEDETFRPQNNTTRAEAATVIARLLTDAE